jgi:hypothetical protein
MRMNLRVRYDRDIAVVGEHALVEVVSEIVAGESLWTMGHNLIGRINNNVTEGITKIIR